MKKQQEWKFMVCLEPLIYKSSMDLFVDTDDICVASEKSIKKSRSKKRK